MKTKITPQLKLAVKRLLDIEVAYEELWHRLDAAGVEIDAGAPHQCDPWGNQRITEVVLDLLGVNHRGPEAEAECDWGITIQNWLEDYQKHRDVDRWIRNALDV